MSGAHLPISSPSSPTRRRDARRSAPPRSTRHRRTTSAGSFRFWRRPGWKEPTSPSSPMARPSSSTHSPSARGSSPDSSRPGAFAIPWRSPAATGPTSSTCSTRSPHPSCRAISAAKCRGACRTGARSASHWTSRACPQSSTTFAVRACSRSRCAFSTATPIPPTRARSSPRSRSIGRRSSSSPRTISPASGGSTSAHRQRFSAPTSRRLPGSISNASSRASATRTSPGRST